MTPAAKRVVRVAFWIVFLGGAAVTGRQIWVKLDPLHNHPVVAPWWLRHNYAKLGSTHRPSAVRAWIELERCFLTKWAAYDWVVWRVKQNVWQKEDPPIHFRLLRSGGRFHASSEGDVTECRTVNEALMAILYQEPGWRIPFQGDWRKWWDANWMSFPNRELVALPSGPEEPRSRGAGGGVEVQGAGLNGRQEGGACNETVGGASAGSLSDARSKALGFPKPKPANYNKMAG